MEPLLHYTTVVVEGIKPLKDLVPGKALANYIGSSMKRLIEPYLIRHKALQEAKTQQMIFEKFPLKRIEITQEIIKHQSDLIPDVAKEAFENAMKIGNMALEYINAASNTKETLSQSYDKDWMNMFIDETQYVSDEKLQQVFARLLKEKIYNPVGVNKRVLNIIRNINSSELETINKYLSCFIDDFIPTDIMNKFDFGIEMMMTLQNIGLVSLNNAPDAFHTIIKTFQIQEDDFCINAKGYYFMFENIVMPFKLELPAYFLTKEGQVIFNMLDVPMREDVVGMYKDILTKNCNGIANLKVRKV